MRLGATSLNVTNRSGGGGSSSPTPTYSLSTDSSVNEGSNLVVNVTTQHVANGTDLYWSISHTTTSNADFSAVSGTATVNSNSASFTITTVADSTTETDPETFGIVVRTGSQSGPIVVQDTSTDLNDTSQTPTYTLAVNGGATSVDEGSSLTFDVEATNGNNTTVYWKITPGSTDPIVLSDFSSATSGSVTTDSAGQASFTITADADATTETDPEYFNVELYTIPAMTGTPAAEVTGLAVNDTSTDPTYALSTSNPAVDEGSSITFNLVTTNFPDQTLYWTVAGVATPTHGRSAASAADFNNVTSGSWSHTNGSSSFSVGPVADATTEGEEEFIVEVHTGSASGPVIADLEPVLINDTSLTPSWSMVSNNGTSEVDEGGSFRVDVTGTNIAGTPTPNWLIRSGGGSTVDQNNTTEFFAYTGTLTNLTQNGSTWTGYFEVFPRNDNTTEGDEIMYIDLYSDSSYGTQLTDVHGQPVSIGPITVRDTSLAQSATMSVSGSTAVDEGSTMTIDVATTGYANGTLYWSVVGDGSYPVNPSVDFQGGDQGTAHLHNVTGTYGAGSTSFTVGPYADTTTESNNNNPEGFAVNLYDDSARTNLISTLGGLTVNDTSQTPSGPTTFSFHYHGYGQGIEPCYVYFVESSTNNVYFLTSFGTGGQTHTAESSPWTFVQLNLTAGGYSGKTGKIAFVQEIPITFYGDMALSGGTYTPGGGTPVNMQMDTPNGRAYWGHNWNLTSTVLAARTTSLSAMGSNVANGRFRTNTGSTGSVNTGPDNAWDNNNSTTYAYFEASSGGSVGDYSVMKMINNITVP
jgi:hypothetical protein